MALRDLFRPRPTASAVTAAATIIEKDDRDEQARIRKGPRKWQREAWQAVDDVAEIGYAANYQAGALGRIRMVPAMRPDPREDPVPLDPDGNDELDLTDEERAACFATINRLGAGPQPISEIQRLVALNLFTCGDGTLVGYDDAGVETWDVLSVDELVPNERGDGYARKISPEGGPGSTVPLPDSAYLARLYQRHARYSGWAYSSMLTVLPLVDELRLLTDAIHAATTSRIPAGILLLSHGFKARPSVDPTAEGQEAQTGLDPNVRKYMEHLEAPVKDRRSAASLTPFVWFADRDDVMNGSKLIEIGREVDQVQAAQRAELITRIATGIDLPAEVLSGKADLNHWTAWQVGEETFKYHLEPDAQLMVNALTFGYYRPHLDAMGIDGTARFLIWYDAGPLTAKPDRTEDVKYAYEHMEASGDALRRTLGLDDGDVPEDDEIAERLWRSLVEQISVRTDGMPTPDDLERKDVAALPAADETAPDDDDDEPDPPPAEGPPPADRPEPAAPSASVVPSLALLAASSSYGTLGQRLRTLDANLRSRLLQAADDAMRRALERAGNRLLTLGQKRLMKPDADALRALDPMARAGWLGPERVTALATSSEDLLDGAFDDLGEKFTAWVAFKQAQARQMLADAAPEPPDPAVLAHAEEQDRTALEAGKALLITELLTAAAAMLFDPTVHAAPRGELTDYAVKPGTVRRALIEAGGGKDGTSGGLTSGRNFHRLMELLRLRRTENYVWVHGDPTRPFEPHEELDGVPLSGPADPKLATDEDWLDWQYQENYLWPGDHDGCTCDVIEEIVPAEAEEAA